MCLKLSTQTCDIHLIWKTKVNNSPICFINVQFPNSIFDFFVYISDSSSDDGVSDTEFRSESEVEESIFFPQTIDEDKVNADYSQGNHHDYKAAPTTVNWSNDKKEGNEKRCSSSSGKKDLPSPQSEIKGERSPPSQKPSNINKKYPSPNKEPNGKSRSEWPQSGLLR